MSAVAGHTPDSDAVAAPASGLRRLLVLIVLVTLYRALALWLGGLDLYVDEAQYWTWAQKLDWGYFSKPPVIAGVIAGTTAVCGDGVWCVKSGALLIYPLVTLLIYGFTRRLFAGTAQGVRIAFAAAFAFLTLPGTAFSSMIISTDVPFFLCWALAFYAYLCALEQDRWHWWLLAGAAMGAGLLTKYTMLIFGLSVLLHLAIEPLQRRHLRSPKPYAAALVALAVFAPNLWWNARHGWPTLRHTTQISHLDHDAGLHWNHLGEFLGGQFAIMGPLLFALWLWQLVRPKTWTGDTRLRMLAIFAVPFLALISLQALLGRANANWGAMAYATGVPFCVALLILRGQRRWLAWAIGLNLLLMPLVYHFDAIKAGVNALATAAGRTTPLIAVDPFKRVRGWAEVGRQAGVVRAQYPEALLLGDSRDTLAEFEYYLRPHPLDTVLWNPQGVMDSHYALTTTMADKRGRDFVFISHDAALSKTALDSFESAEPLPPLHVTITPDYALDFHVWHLQNFKGYAVGPRDPTPE